MKISQNIKIILKTYLLVLSLLSIYRVILFFAAFDKLNYEETALSEIISAFIMGVRFDIVKSGYVLLIPALFLFILDIINVKGKYVKAFFFYWIFILFSTGFLVNTADIPYFIQFFDRFSVGAFEWMDNTDFVFSMIVQEPKYFLAIVPFIILNVLFFIALKRVFKTKEDSRNVKIGYKIGISVLILFIMFIGVRGRIALKSPIRVGTAYASNNPFLNKLGLNPTFTLIRSYLDSKDPDNVTIKLIDSDVAIKNTQSYLGIKDVRFNSPIAREINNNGEVIKPNIVLVLMESMSVAKMKRYGNPNNLTPFLDSLSNNSMYFENFYSAGKHTFNGIFSSLFSFPAIYRQHSMKRVLEHDGISHTLRKNGFSTIYFTTHDSQFDNVEGFLKANDFERIVSQEDYPSDKVVSTLGVPDDYMFEFSIPILNELSEKEKPFFATLITTSDHGPYHVPEYFTPKNDDIKLQITEYADWSLNKFFKLCLEQDWSDNTIFVFAADHGYPMNINYEISLNYFHSPLIFYSPKILDKDTVHNCIGSQIDIYPTLMGMINMSYINNTLGVDLLNEKRKYAIINDDDKIGIIDTNYFCIFKDEATKLYDLNSKNKTSDISKENPEKVKDMVNYASSNLQVYQDMLLRMQTSVEVSSSNGDMK